MSALQVLLTGARTATLLQRLPYLPAADAYVAENGGRIFYPDQTLPTAMPLMEDSKWRKAHNAAGACRILCNVQTWGITAQNIMIVLKMHTAAGATMGSFLGRSHRERLPVTNDFDTHLVKCQAWQVPTSQFKLSWSAPSSATQPLTFLSQDCKLVCRVQRGPPPRRTWSLKTARGHCGTAIGSCWRRAGRQTSPATPPASGAFRHASEPA
jgi:hypothetical protein